MKIQCKECEEFGHYVRDCPNKKCRNCEKPGHPARECPVIPISLEPCVDYRNLVTPRMSNAGIVSRWVISLVIVVSQEPILAAYAIIANLLVLPLLSNLMSDHMSRECPQPRQNGHGGQGQERRTERDTLSGDNNSLGRHLMVGGRVTSNEPLPSWEPVAQADSFGGGESGGGGAGW
jgi:hypothetical protein